MDDWFKTWIDEPAQTRQYEELMSEAREHMEDEAQRQNFHKMEDLIKETLFLKNMGRKIKQNVRYNRHRSRIDMELPRLFSIKRAKRIKRSKTMLKIDKQLKHRDFAMFLPIAIVSSLINNIERLEMGSLG